MRSNVGPSIFKRFEVETSCAGSALCPEPAFVFFFSMQQLIPKGLFISYALFFVLMRLKKKKNFHSIYTSCVATTRHVYPVQGLHSPLQSSFLTIFTTH